MGKRRITIFFDLPVLEEESVFFPLAGEEVSYILSAKTYSNFVTKLEKLGVPRELFEPLPPYLYNSLREPYSTGHILGRMYEDIVNPRKKTDIMKVMIHIEPATKAQESP